MFWTPGKHGEILSADSHLIINLMLLIPNWSGASQKLEEQVRRNILHNNPADCERVLDMDISKSNLYPLQDSGSGFNQKVVPRNHLPKPIKITAEDRKSIISIKEAFSKKGEAK